MSVKSIMGLKACLDDQGVLAVLRTRKGLGKYEASCQAVQLKKKQSKQKNQIKVIKQKPHARKLCLKIIVSTLILSRQKSLDYRMQWFLLKLRVQKMIQVVVVVNWHHKNNCGSSRSIRHSRKFKALMIEFCKAESKGENVTYLVKNIEQNLSLLTYLTQVGIVKDVQPHVKEH